MATLTAEEAAPHPSDDDDDPQADEASYIDYETFLAPDFSPTAFANALVVATNNPHDTPLDLSTRLSRVLFDAQELDAHIDRLVSKHAEPLLKFTETQTQAGERIADELESQLQGLNDSYQQLERNVIDKHAEADEVRHVALRLIDALSMGRGAARCLQLGRQLEVQHSELVGGRADEDHGALLRASQTIVLLREVLEAKGEDEEGYGLEHVHVVRSLQDGVINPIERSVRETAERSVREFSASSNMTFLQSTESRARLTSATLALYLLSPTMGISPDHWTPRLLLQSLEYYTHSALQTSITVLSRSLGQLPSLERALTEVTARCQNVVCLGLVLASIKPPAHLLLPTTVTQKHPNFLDLLLSHLETGSLTSYFWRTMAGSLASRVQDIVARGGVVARTLKSNKHNVADAIRQAVIKGSRPPAGFSTGEEPTSAVEGNWDREVAVMVGCVVNHLGR